MKKLFLVLMAVSVLLSACTININTRGTTEAPTDPTEETFAHSNSVGPFDDEHYNIGFEALYCIDRYLCGKNPYSSVLSVELKQCYEKISALPDDPEGSPYKDGNDFVESYVFLPYSYFGMDPGKLDERLIEGRGYLADALGVTAENLVTIGD